MQLQQVQYSLDRWIQEVLSSRWRGQCGYLLRDGMALFDKNEKERGRKPFAGQSLPVSELRPKIKLSKKMGPAAQKVRYRPRRLVFVRSKVWAGIWAAEQPTSGSTEQVSAGVAKREDLNPR